MKAAPLAERIRQQREARLARDARQPKHQQPERSYPVVGLDDEMRFGKHKGKTLRDVIDEDPKWVEWAMSGIKTFEITDDALDHLTIYGTKGVSKTRY